jgi:hypothetical protein
MPCLQREVEAALFAQWTAQDVDTLATSERSEACGAFERPIFLASALRSIAEPEPNRAERNRRRPKRQVEPVIILIHAVGQARRARARS